MATHLLVAPRRPGAAARRPGWPAAVRIGFGLLFLWGCGYVGIS